jgi:DNA excision repair protein ERCC-4
LFKTYASELHLVYVLSSHSNEEEYFKDRLLPDDARIMSITNEHTATERKELYAGGGVFFVTSRILVVDFLRDVIPAEKITGFIVLRAHNVVENSQVVLLLLKGIETMR